MASKVLIADATACAEVLAQKAVSMGLAAQICSNGAQVMDNLRQFTPDVMVLDLMMPHMDGLTILSQMENLQIRPACMVTTGFVSTFVEQRVTELGADYMMRKPFDFEAAMDRILDLLEVNDHAPPMAPRTHSQFAEKLLALGFSLKRRGFHYLDASLAIYCTNPQISVTKELYPMVAKQFNTTPTSVERAIRTVIQDAWTQGNHKDWQQYFSCTPSGYVPRPTNTAFLTQLINPTCLPPAKVCAEGHTV